MQHSLLLRAGTRLLPNKEVVSRKLAERELPLPVHRRVWSQHSSSRSLLRGRGEGRLPRGRAPGSLRQGGGRKGLAGLGGVEAFPEFLRWLPNLWACPTPRRPGRRSSQGGGRGACPAGGRSARLVQRLAISSAAPRPPARPAEGVPDDVFAQLQLRVRVLLRRDGSRPPLGEPSAAQVPPRFGPPAATVQA